MTPEGETYPIKLQCIIHIAGSSQNGSALRREFSGGSYGAKRQPKTSPSDGSLSSGGPEQGSEAPARDYEREVRLPYTDQ